MNAWKYLRIISSFIPFENDNAVEEGNGLFVILWQPFGLKQTPNNILWIWGIYIPCNELAWNCYDEHGCLRVKCAKSLQANKKMQKSLDKSVSITAMIDDVSCHLSLRRAVCLICPPDWWPIGTDLTAIQWTTFLQHRPHCALHTKHCYQYGLPAKLGKLIQVAYNIVSLGSQRLTILISMVSYFNVLSHRILRKINVKPSVKYNRSGNRLTTRTHRTLGGSQGLTKCY